MSPLYDPAKIRALADTGDPFYRGAWWILRQQEAAQITGKPRASLMSDKISMDEAREKVRAEQDRKISRELWFRAQEERYGGGLARKPPIQLSTGE